MLLSCEKRDQENCLENQICSWNQEMKRCQASMAWFHPMKCGSTFGATLAHFANSSLPEMAHMPTCSGTLADGKEDSCNPKTKLQGPLEFFRNKYPLDVWFRDVFWTASDSDKDPANHRPVDDEAYEEWKGHFVGLFRQPKSRVASAYNHFSTRSVRTPENLRRFSRVSLGVVTMMLSGEDGKASIGCEFRWPTMEQDPGCQSDYCKTCMTLPTEAQVAKAISRLDGFAFVGLTDHFDLSVCLFHAMFGGDCYPVEFVNMRPAVYRQNFTQQLDGFEDPFDQRIYNAASQIFWANVRRFNLNKVTCQRICPNSGVAFD